MSISHVLATPSHVFALVNTCNLGAYKLIEGTRLVFHHNMSLVDFHATLSLPLDAKHVLADDKLDVVGLVPSEGRRRRQNSGLQGLELHLRIVFVHWGAITARVSTGLRSTQRMPSTNQDLGRASFASLSPTFIPLVLAKVIKVSDLHPSTVYFIKRQVFLLSLITVWIFLGLFDLTDQLGDHIAAFAYEHFGMFATAHACLTVARVLRCRLMHRYCISRRWEVLVLESALSDWRIHRAWERTRVRGVAWPETRVVWVVWDDEVSSVVSTSYLVLWCLQATPVSCAVL